MIKASALKPVKNECLTTMNSGNSGYPSVVENMAVRMLHIYKDIEEVLTTFGRVYSHNETKFIISLKGMEKEQKENILEWLEDMRGAVGMFHFESKSEIVSGWLEDLPRARRFLTGGFMEIAIAKKTERIVSRLASMYGKAYEVKCNVYATTLDGLRRNEFDVVINFDKTMYVIEVKTGNHFRDYSKYYNIALRHNIEANRILLVDSQIKESEAELAEYFSGYYVSNLERFTEKLTRMIQNDMEVKHYA